MIYFNIRTENKGECDMKMFVIKNAESALRKLVNAELPIKLAFQISSMVDEIDTHLQKFEEFRVELVKKYGEKTENGIEVKNNVDEFNKEINDLMNAEVTVNITPVDMDVFMNIDNVNLSVTEIKALQMLGLIK
jgi:hypothetical protein